MSTRVEQALREYQDAVARSVASQEAQQGSDTHAGREKRSSATIAQRAGHSSDYAKVAEEWTRYLEAWHEEGTGEWFAPFLGESP